MLGTVEHIWSAFTDKCGISQLITRTISGTKWGSW